MTARAAAATTTTTQVPPRRLVFSDTLTPVVSEGLPFGIAQAVDTPSQRTFLIGISTATNGVGSLGTDQMGTYTPGPYCKVGFALHMAGVNLFWCPTQNSLTAVASDSRYGLPGVAAWGYRLTYNNSTTNVFRIVQRAYRVPGVQNVLYLEYEVGLDTTIPQSTTAPTGNFNLDLMFETQTGHIESLAFDSTLDALPIIGIGGAANNNPSYFYVKPLSHPSSGHIYESDLATDYHFATGTLGANVDTWNTTANQTYRGHLSTQDSGHTRDRQTTIFRYAISCGMDPQMAKAAIQNIPNVSHRAAVSAIEGEVESYPQLNSSSGSEQLAWKLHLHSLVHNLGTASDWWPENFHRDGVPRRLPQVSKGRWQGMWTMDNHFGILGSEAVAPDVVRDTLDVFFNVMMDGTGFLRGAPGVAGKVQHGSFMSARILRRYLAFSGDTSFATSLYTKLKLMWTWWTTTSGYQHPSWPTVYLLTGKYDVEIQEASQVTMGGNFPSGEVWTSAMAYDFCVHMAALAAATGNSSDVAGWNTAATNLRTAIQTYCWDSGTGWYQPTMTAASPNGGQVDNLGRFNLYLTYRAFWVLYAGVATPAQAQIMRDKIMDSTYFLGTYGVRTADHHWAGYDANDWVKGGSRPYHDAAAIIGLRRYGFATDADTLLAKWTNNQLLKGTTPEMVNPDSGGGGFARHLLPGNMLMEAYLYKNDPSKLFNVGTSQVTS